MEITETLSPGEQGELFRLEAVISRGVAAFREVGEALAIIQQKRLYRATHRTFESYMLHKWNISRPRAYQLIEAAAVTSSLEAGLSTNCRQKTAIPLPQNEAQARAIAQAPPEMRAPVWQQAVQAAGGQAPPASSISEILQKVHSSSFRPEQVIAQVRQQEAEALALGAELDKEAQEGTADWHVGKADWHLKQVVRHLGKARSPCLEDVEQVRAMVRHAHGLEVKEEEEEEGQEEVEG